MKSVESILRRLPLSKLFRRSKNTSLHAGNVAENIIDVNISGLEEMSSFYSQFFKADDLVFDVGANLGNRSQAFLKQGARVVAFEPQSVCAQRLRDLFQSNDRFDLEQCVLGDTGGNVDMLLCDSSTISSLSTDWIDAVQKSGRFSNYSWNKKESVQMTTLDRMIEKYGAPKFVKIDVEGSELKVLRGLSSPVSSASFEFVPEFIDSTYKCIRHLESLGAASFNYCVGEELKLVLDGYVSASEMIAILSEFVASDPTNFGDVYYRSGQ